MINIPEWAEFTFESSPGGRLFCGNDTHYQLVSGGAHPIEWSYATSRSWRADDSAKPVVFQLEND